MKREFCLECPCCHYVMDSASAMPSNHPAARPKVGDLSLCGRCGAALVFTPCMELAQAQEGDLSGIPHEQLKELRMAQLLISMRTSMKNGRS